MPIASNKTDESGAENRHTLALVLLKQKAAKP